MGLRVIEGGNRSVNGLGMADYIWLDEVGNIHVKKRAIFTVTQSGGLEVVPHLEPWVVSARPVHSEDKDEPERRILVPDHYLVDPLRGPGNFAVLCEVRDEHNKIHWSNQRATLRAYLEKQRDPLGTQWGFQQTYRLLPKGQGPKKPTKETWLAAERHLTTCLDAGLPLHSGQIEATDGKWTFKIGPRDFPNALDPDPCSAIMAPDFFVFARYFLEKIAQEMDFHVEYQNCGVTYSTDALRSMVDGGQNTPSLSAAEIGAHVAANLKFPTDELSTLHEWVPQIRVGLHCKSQLREHQTHSFVQDKGLLSNADPYAVVTRILTALENLP